MVGCGKETDVPDGMKLASNEENKFYTMYVPEDWYVIETGSNVTLAQAQSKQMGGTTSLEPVTVNAMIFGISDPELIGSDNIDKSCAEYYKTYQEQMAGTFKEFYNLTNLDEAHASPYREDARAYSFVALYNNIYYKYYMTVIVRGQTYYVITFNFPQNNVEADKDGKLIKTEYEKAEFDDGDYNDEIKDVVSSFKAKL